MKKSLPIERSFRRKPTMSRTEERRMRVREGFKIPGWSVGYHADISAHAAVRTPAGKGRDWLFVMTSDDREPRSFDEEATVGLLFFNGDDWEQVAHQDFLDVRSVIKLGDAELQLIIEQGLTVEDARNTLADEFYDWEQGGGEDALGSWMETILKDADVRIEEAGVEAASDEAVEQINNASPAQILAYMNERSEAINE